MSSEQAKTEGCYGFQLQQYGKEFSNFGIWNFHHTTTRGRLHLYNITLSWCAWIICWSMSFALWPKPVSIELMCVCVCVYYLARAENFIHFRAYVPFHDEIWRTRWPSPRLKMRRGHPSLAIRFRGGPHCTQ